MFQESSCFLVSARRWLGAPGRDTFKRGERGKRGGAGERGKRGEARGSAGKRGEARGSGGPLMVEIIAALFQEKRDPSNK